MRRSLFVAKEHLPTGWTFYLTSSFSGGNIVPDTIVATRSGATFTCIRRQRYRYTEWESPPVAPVSVPPQEWAQVRKFARSRLRDEWLDSKPPKRRYD